MADFIKQSWVFPVIQSIHLIGLTMLVGSICLVDLRILGIGKRQAATDLASTLAPWTLYGLLTVIITGPLMFWSDLARYVINPAFLLKMGLLAVTLTLHFTLHRRVIRDGTMARSAGISRQKLAAVLSLILWSSIVLAGRAIADFDIRVV
jgi:uncharacterized protein DUF6644